MTAEERDRRAFEIFSEACALPATQRGSTLERACNGDAELRRRVEAMLKADEGADAGAGAGDGAGAGAGERERVAIGSELEVDAFLSRQVHRILPEMDTVTRADAMPIADDTEYTILRVIGEGGMGTVYEAEQHNPRRRVAIKAIRPGHITPQMRKRFEYEAQVLARLEHVGIARLYEFNTQSEGGRIRAFLAMELVVGEPIDAYATKRHLDVRERLRLFMRVCEAIAYAHRIGVIHRDLKPANIVVNEEGEPKVLDFGVALAVEGNNFVATAVTEHGQIVGTLAYMSPEQVEGRDAIDTRADVYSLGVILYKMLTGALPIEVAGANLVTVTHRVLTETPRRLGEHDKRLRGDLEVILAKTLEKEPARRYRSVEQLRDELGRYLAGRAIEARADSTFYLVRKAIWRYRAAVAVGLSILFLIVMFAIYAWIQASRNRGLAEAANDSRGAAVRSAAEATQRAGELRQSLYFSNIGFAQSALEANDMERAKGLLDGCEVGLRGWEWSYLQRLCDLSADTVELRVNRPRYASFSRDRSLVALATLGREVALLRNPDQQELLRVTLPEGAARAVLSPDGRWLAYGGMPDTIFLFEVATGARQELRIQSTRPATEPAAALGLRSLAFSHDSRMLVSAGLDRALRVWDVADRKVRRTIPLGAPPPICMLLSPGGDWAAVGDFSGGLRLFDLASGKLRRKLVGHDAPVWSLAMSPDGKRLASGDNDARVIVWEVASGEPVTQLDTNDGWITALCFSPDGSTIAEGRADSTIRLLHLPDAATSGVLRGHRRAVIHVDWLPDGTLHTISMDGTSKRWDERSALQVPTIVTGQPQSNGLAFDPSGQIIFVGGSDGTVRSWRVKPDDRGERVSADRDFPKHEDVVLEIAVDPVGRRIATAGRDGIVRISNMDDSAAAAVKVIAPGTGAISALCFAGDGKQLFVGTAGELSTWDVSSGRKARDYSAPGLVANELTFDGTGEHFFVACADGRVRRWRVDSTAPVAETMVDPAGAYEVALSPDGRAIVVTGDTQSVALLDAQSLTIIRRFIGHQGAALGAAFHPGGQRLATCGSDRSIRIWDIQTATELIALRGHRRSVQHIEFSADGKTLASTSDDGTVKLWRTIAAGP